MIQRYLKIKNFRNIGDNSYQKFDLNVARTPKDTLGGLVTLIGMNNTGKSNFLDALNALGLKNIQNSDLPYYSYEPGIESTIVMWLRDTNEKDGSTTDYQYKLKKDKVFIEKYINDKLIEEKQEKNKNQKIKFDADGVNILEHMSNSDVYNKIFRNLQRSNLKSVYNNDVNQYTSAIQRIKQQTASLEDYQNIIEFMNLPAFKDIAQNHFGFASEENINRLISFIKQSLDGMDKNEYIDEVKNNYGLNLIPSIIKYDDSKAIKQSDTMSGVNKNGLENPKFFKILFNLLKNRNFEELENAYKKFFASPTSIHPLTNYQRSVNKELDKLAEGFNKVYGQANDKQYGFGLKLESSKVYFVLSENGSDVPYESQSTGFRWFFNFFFNVFADDTLKNGDIVILDEPATNLHVSGQIELRKQIRQFGIDNGITFVLSTHSPFLIDVDYLDEIRIVSKNGLNSILDNKFSVSDKRIIDVLMPIQSSLTIGRHIISDPNKTLIFVEGITDYNYLVAFKEHFEYDNLTFLPIQGIKDTKKVFTKLLENFVNPIILVDSDFYGQKAKQESEKEKHVGVEVRQLNEIDDTFKYIENLFSEDDHIKFLPEKSYNRSTHFKNYFKNYKSKLSKQTLLNFKKLFENLMV